MSRSPVIGNDLLPPLWVSADESSVQAQRSYMNLTRVRLSLLVCAAAAGIFTLRFGLSSVDWLSAVSLLVFVTALTIDLFLLKNRPDRLWYQARAVAESVKTLSWKYSVGGAPYGIELTRGEAIQQLTEDFAGVVANAELPSQIGVVGGATTDAMDELRTRSLTERRSTYLAGRVEDQQSWYSSRARDKTRSANLWRYVLLALEIVGVLGALAKTTGLIEVSLDGFVATAIAGAGAWLEARRDEQTARAYIVTSADLSNVHSRLLVVVDEPDWSRLVADAEDAISREHTMWKAARSVS